MDSTCLEVSPTIWGELFSALAGAFFGALAAYWFQLTSEKKKDAENNYRAIIRAQIALVTQRNTLKSLDDQHLEQHRNDPERHMKMGIYTLDVFDQIVEADSLSFLARPSDVVVILDVHLSQRQYLSAINALRNKNEAYERVLMKSELGGINETQRKASIRPDPREAMLLQQKTDTLYQMITEARKQNDEAFVKLRAIGKKIFPKRCFISVTDKPTKESTNQGSTKP
jgi:hypothetical protein